MPDVGWPLASEDVRVLCHRGHRRFELYAAAAAAAGRTAVPLTWGELVGHTVSGTWPDLPPDAEVRVDSPGEDAEVEAQLRALGGHHEPLAHGEIGGGAAWVEGMLAVVRHLAAAPGGVRLDTSADDLAVLFDKRATHARLDAAGVPVPAAGPAVSQLWDRPGRWFVKPAHGSSGSGVVALQVGRDRLEALAPVEVVDGVPFNDFEVRRHRDDAARDLVELLAARGPLHVERWFPKAMLGPHRTDLRVVVVDGVARNVVARGSRTPMTNLHLGNARLDLAEVRARAGGAWSGFLAVAEAAAACFTDTRCVGVDVLVGSDWRRCAVAEVNAFGDLLPGSLHEGRSTYDWQVVA